VSTCAIVIATYGDEKWGDMAQKRALPSAEIQEVDEIIVYHEKNGTLASCRNNAIKKVSSDWIIILDADDQLESDYASYIRKSAGDLRYPAVRSVPGTFSPGSNLPEIKLLHKRNLLLGNYMVIGTMFRRKLFEFVGGFQEFPAWEDWYLWLQMTHLGARVNLVSQAVYRIFEVGSGRNSSVRNPAELFESMRKKFKQWALLQNSFMECSDTYNDFLKMGPV
jgi:glycosyltransferase involved in cell wall biosynthesis